MRQKHSVTLCKACYLVKASIHGLFRKDIMFIDKGQDELIRREEEGFSVVLWEDIVPAILQRTPSFRAGAVGASIRLRKEGEAP